MNGFREYIGSYIDNKEILILGFGAEGKSIHQYIRKIRPEIFLSIVDDSEDAAISGALNSDTNSRILGKEECKEIINDFDLIIKSPGFPLDDIETGSATITSQTDLFLQYFHRQIIGVTGTKGKSTTSSLIHEILLHAGLDSFLAGNIGLPVFDIADSVKKGSWVVFELSAHQLEFINKSPSIAILLNTYQDHLDHFGSLENYGSAKLNILKYQEKGDEAILNARQIIKESVAEGVNISSFSQDKLPVRGAFGNVEHILYQNEKEQTHYEIGERKSLFGAHNADNIMAAVCCSRILGIDPELVAHSINQFKGLPHRMEFVGEYRSIKFFNDAIATIPEACIHAIEALGEVETLILGGKDRGIDYTGLVSFLGESSVRNILFSGSAGRRIHDLLLETGCGNRHCKLMDTFGDFFELAIRYTSPGKICLLSPAASSYDEFKNFEEKGNYYKKNISDARMHR